MEDFIKEATEDTPEFNFNATSGKLLLKGSSYPEDRVKIYEPVINWLKTYAQSPAPKTELTVDMDYFNSASYTAILLILQVVEGMQSKGEVSIIWKYYVEDLDMKEMGKEFSECVSMDFEFIPTED